jgi:peptidoglycan LD-endopeptidase LytH
MTRLGWAMIAAIVFVAAGFLLLVRGGQVSTTGSAVIRPDANAGSGGPLAIPVAGVGRNALVDSFGDPRGGGTRRHGAEDILAPRGTPVLAAHAGRIEKLFESAQGGHTIYIRSPDGALVTYYAHLDSYAAGLAEGRQVSRGEVIGAVGASGNADPAAPHLHFEVKRMRAGEKWYQGTPVNPFPLLADGATAR